MSLLGKFIGGVAGFAMGGPYGALFGAALGHAADEGRLRGLAGGFASRVLPFDPLWLAIARGQTDQVFTIAVTVLAAKLCKCDGVVTHAEINAFKGLLDIPGPDMVAIARLFDSASSSAEGFEPYAVQLGLAFSDNRAVLEQVLAQLYQIARADGPVNEAEAAFLARVTALLWSGNASHRRFGWGAPPVQPPSEDPYIVLGIKAQASADEIRARWKQLIREHHPDRVAAQGGSQALVEQASERTARINAAYDYLRRVRGL